MPRRAGETERGGNASGGRATPVQQQWQLKAKAHLVVLTPLRSVETPRAPLRGAKDKTPNVPDT